ncbi:glycosyltransferase [Agrococcus sediminis]|uniref:glycosyltransferase n=1 Tax=Agrococcus sediminis TaxID=2599924 RepID=UPI001788DF57|nr:glycosyltransferase [Agrococcus sediminis]
MATVALGTVLAWTADRGSGVTVAILLPAIVMLAFYQRRSAIKSQRWLKRIALAQRQAPRASADRRGGQAMPQRDGSSNDVGLDVLDVLLQSSRIFEQDYYEAQRRHAFADARAARLDFLGSGMGRLESPNRLLDPARLPGTLQQRYREGDLVALLEFLRQSPASLPGLSDSFSPSMVEASAEHLRTHPGGALGWFVENARHDDLLPSRKVHARWSQFTAATESAVAAEHARWRLDEARWTAVWDEAAEKSWKRTLNASRRSAAEPSELVSVIMPVWNRRRAVRKAIASVQAQRWSAWELIVVDDGSEDGSFEAVQAIAELDRRIKVVRSEHAGVSAARNRGLDLAGGSWVAFLDSDNIWREDFLSCGIAALQRSSGLIGHAVLKSQRADAARYLAFEGGRDELLTKNHIDLNSLIVHRSLLERVGRFDESLRRWVDHDFALRLSEHAVPELLPFVGCEYSDSDDVNRISERESGDWERVVLDKAWSRWEEAQSCVEGRVSGRVSIVIPMKDQPDMTVRAVRAALETTRVLDVEVVVVDNGSSFASRVQLASALCGEARVRVAYINRNLDFSIGSNVGLSRSTGQFVVFLNNDTIVRPGWLTPLVDALQSRDVAGVQPLLVYPDNSIQTGGTVWVEDNVLPVHFMTGHPPEDAAGLELDEFPALTAAALAVRAHEALALHGFDPRYRNGMEDVDFCLRLRELHGGVFRVLPRAQVVHDEGRTPGRSRHKDENRRLFMDRWSGRLPRPSHEIFRNHGLVLAEIEHDNMAIPSPLPRFHFDRGELPARWGIRHAAPGGAAGDAWGDTIFVAALADALRAEGKNVVTYRDGANERLDDMHDDVSVVLRGKKRLPPVPGACNILWVISHPDEVSDEELAEFDIVYAASASWAARRSKDSGVEIRTLLQCTDATRFFPADRELEASRPAVFVGSVHPGRRRRVVADAVAAGVALTVIGQGWDSSLPPGVLERDFVDSARLAEVYRSASRVLADHWRTMADEGFIQNRIFDALACAAPVISDPVQGLDETFGGAVAIYNSQEDLAKFCAASFSHPAGDWAARRALAQSIRSQHSFDARATTLVSHVDEMRHEGIRTT